MMTDAEASRIWARVKPGDNDRRHLVTLVEWRAMDTTRAALVTALEQAQTDFIRTCSPLGGELGARFGERERLLAQIKEAEA